MSDPHSLHKQTVIHGVLTSLFDISEAQDLRHIPGLELYHPDAEGAEKFQSYKAFGNAPITPESISRARITVTGDGGKAETVYYKKIVQSAATDNDIGKVTNKTVDADADNKGFKGTAWIKTDQNGNPLLHDGKAEIRLSFGGYKGNPTAMGSQQNQYALAIEQGRLSPAASQVPAFIDKVQATLKAQGIPSYDAYVGAHSMGSVNALTAAALGETRGMNVKSVLLIEPVAASLAQHLLEKPQNAHNLGTTPEKVRAAISKTTCIRSISFNADQAACSNSAMLKICGPDQQTEADYTKVHRSNMGIFGNGLGGIAQAGRDGNAPEKLDSNNRMVGTEMYLYLDRKTIGKENPVASMVAMADPTHVLSHIVFSTQKKAPMSASIEALKTQTQKAPEALKIQPQEAPQQETPPEKVKMGAWKIDEQAVQKFAATLAKLSDNAEMQAPRNPQHGLDGMYATPPQNKSHGLG